ncbi:hypothetical protein FA15DRAFT_752501 [Coprinopsis marcescibilis]|uniref:Cryptic loci regulator 2 N-terminal domain-containing protein n=1 Tax=Coprinopsis marcescibilis TaxID=230819 RepID=A0A5C3L9K6_COPMA|nr:hypothetical protein FA15DRAFT_752501 [Coprinopsis marcescibilis]
MSKGRNIAQANVKVPENPIFVDFERSDGDPATWPKNVIRTVDNEGQVNWMQHLPLDDPTALKWRLQVGKHIAADSGVEDPQEKDRWILRDWPTNYRIYDHNKGPDKGNIRHDIYLYGPQSKRFRSINEFIPHAIWLLRDETMDSRNCACKYCSKRQQKDISSTIVKALGESPAAVGSSSKGSTSSPSLSKAGELYSKLQKDALKARERQGPSQSRRETRPKPQREQAKRVYATVQKPLRPVAKVSDNVVNHSVLAERHEDLRAIYSSAANKKQGTGREPLSSLDQEVDSETGLRRWYRTAEYVWCKLPGDGITISKTTQTNSINELVEIPVKIEFWPGIVESYSLKCTPVPRIPPHNGTTLPSSATSISAPQTSTPRDDDVTPWTVKQHYDYHVRFLAVDTKSIFRDENILPYLAYTTPPLMMDIISHLPMDKLDFAREKVAKFDPIQALGSDEEPNYDAASAYALATQLAETASTYWCVTDKWNFQYIPYKSKTERISTTHNGPSLATPTPTSSTSALPLAPVQSTSSVGSDSHRTHHGVSRINSTTLANQDDEDAQRFLGTGYTLSPKRRPPPVASMSDAMTAAYNSAAAAQAQRPIITASASHKSNAEPANAVQVRYQGMWVGPERIWVDDFVRLKVSRGALAPNGAPNVLKPSGFGKAALEFWEQKEQFSRKQEILRQQRAAENASGKGKGREIDPKEAEILAMQLPDRPTEAEMFSKGTFMRIDSLFAVDVEKDGRMKKEMRVSGMLYELAEEDWECDDPQEMAKARGDTFEATVNEALLPSTPPKKSDSAQPSLQRRTAQPSPPARYLEPQAPMKFRFRPILTPGYEAIISLSLISGRYYPRILRHPLLWQLVQQAFNTKTLETEVKRYEKFWALEGLVGGFANSLNPEDYKKSRTAMLEEADKNASDALEDYRVQCLNQQEDDDDGGGGMGVVDATPSQAESLSGGDVEMEGIDDEAQPGYQSNMELD